MKYLMVALWIVVVGALAILIFYLGSESSQKAPPLSSPTKAEISCNSLCV